MSRYDGNGRYTCAIVRQFYGLICVHYKDRIAILMHTYIINIIIIIIIKIIIIHCPPIPIKYFIKLNLIIYAVHDHE